MPLFWYLGGASLAKDRSTAGSSEQPAPHLRAGSGQEVSSNCSAEYLVGLSRHRIPRP